MPDWLKFAVIGLLAAGGTNVAQFVGVTKPAITTSVEASTFGSTMQGELTKCMDDLRACYKACP